MNMSVLDSIVRSQMYRLQKCISELEGLIGQQNAIIKYNCIKFLIAKPTNNKYYKPIKQ